MLSSLQTFFRTNSFNTTICLKTTRSPLLTYVIIHMYKQAIIVAMFILLTFMQCWCMDMNYNSITYSFLTEAKTYMRLSYSASSVGSTRDNTACVAISHIETVMN